jgi:Alkylmercury lyase
VTPADAPSERDWDVRAAVYRRFVDTTRGPTLADLAAATELPEPEVQASLRRLEAAHQLALFPDARDVWMAPPFSATPTAFPVETPRGRYWANCAWDALGIPPLVGTRGLVETHCAGGGGALSLTVTADGVEGDDALVHLLVPVRYAWDDIGYT